MARGLTRILWCALQDLELRSSDITYGQFAQVYRSLMYSDQKTVHEATCLPSHGPCPCSPAPALLASALLPCLGAFGCHFSSSSLEAYPHMSPQPFFLRAPFPVASHSDQVLSPADGPPLLGSLRPKVWFEVGSWGSLCKWKAVGGGGSHVGSFLAAVLAGSWALPSKGPLIVCEPCEPAGRQAFPFSPAGQGSGRSSAECPFRSSSSSSSSTRRYAGLGWAWARVPS